MFYKIERVYGKPLVRQKVTPRTAIGCVGCKLPLKKLAYHSQTKVRRCRVPTFKSRRSKLVPLLLVVPLC
jgi:hypothetical protein